jgi:glycosyltransferase involved in cell wall biosynthesis
MRERNKSVSVFFMVPSPPGIAPGQRFRFEHYLDAMAEKGIRYKISPYYSVKGRRSLYTKSGMLAKALVIAKGYLRRITDLLVLWRYDYVYVHKEVTPVGPPVFPWVAVKIFRKKLIYDFDDAIWIPIMSDYNRRFSFLKNFSQVAKLCRWSYKVTVGNAYLKEYAAQYNRNVVIIPTVVDTEKTHNILQQQETERPAIGWTGSFSTLSYLEIVLPVLRELQEELDFTFYVIADKDPQLPLSNYRFIRWQRETEVQDLLKFHIGLMPLRNDEFSKGKCGFKAIQYMSLGIPAVVSPVGVNAGIVLHGENGFVCNTPEEWKACLLSLLRDTSLRKKFGAAARERIENNYSVKSSSDLFFDLFIE